MVWFSNSAFLIWMVCLVLRVDSKTPCPTPSEACDCTDADDGFVDCAGMTDIPANIPMTTVFLNLDSNPIGSALLGHKMENIKTLSLEQLYLSGIGLEAIENRAFIGQPTLRTLDLSKNNLKTLNDQTFYGLVQLETLFLTGSSIFEISPLSFTLTPSLVFLDLDNNMLTEINNEFVSLSQLESLLISSNKLTSISENAFRNLERLDRLDLYDNQLSTPDKSWFENLVSNNGTLRLRAEDKADNPWNCCAYSVKEYKEFLDSLPTRYKETYGVKCSLPRKLENRQLEEISTKLLQDSCTNDTSIVSTIAGAVTTVGGIPGTTIAQSTQKETKNPGNGTDGAGFAVSDKQSNIFSHLADAHVVLILLAVAVLIAACTALVVRQYYVRQKSKAFDKFMDDVPNSREEENGDEAGLTTRTYRQDAKVYGSTGQVVDRHINGLSSASITDETSSEDSNPPASAEKRKPPPYEPTTPISPVEYEFDGTFNTTQFNNSSSAGMDFSGQRIRSGAFTNYGYNLDDSDDL